MAATSTIEWTDATWNVVTGCSLASPGCANCYAMRLAGTRLKDHWSRAGLTKPSKAGPVWTGALRFNERWLDQPLRWTRPRRIFVAAHSDLFHERMTRPILDRIFAVMCLATQHRFQVLTKRGRRMRDYMNNPGVLSFVAQEAAQFFRRGRESMAFTWPPSNVWLGVSAEDQARADERIPALLDTQAALRFVSLEPLLGPIDLTRITDVGLDALHGVNERRQKIDWVIVGGESGPGARPMHPDWVRTIRDHCDAAGVPFFFKQWGAWLPTAQDDGQISFGRHAGHCWHRDTTRETWTYRVGKNAAGAKLDGSEHREMPG